MKKYTKEVKAGILILLGLLCLVIGIQFLKSKNIFKRDNTYYAKFKHSAGLAPGSAVTINGLKVGVVDEIGLEEGTAKIIVSFSVDKNVVFSKKTKAQIFSSILGNPGLQLLPIFEKENLAQSGDTLPSSVKLGPMESLMTQMEPTQQRLNSVLDNVDKLITSFNEILNVQNKTNISRSIEQMNQMMEQWNKVSRALSENTIYIENTLKNVSETSSHVAKLSSSLSRMEIDSMMTQVNHSLTQLERLLTSAEKGEGSLGKLLKDEQLYNNINQASQNLSLLLEDLRVNPKRYVHFSIFGGRTQKDK